MATKRQLQANIRNAQHSTGPRSAEGKATSSRNALKTGLYALGTVIGYESSAQLSELEAQFTAQFQPVNPDERSLVDALIHSEWMLRRYRWVETEVWKAARMKLSEEETQSTPAGFSFINEPSISRIHRLRTATQRQFRETLHQLLQLQATRADADPIHLPPDPSQEPQQPSEPSAAEPQTPREPAESTATSPRIGFVPSTSGSSRQSDVSMGQDVPSDRAPGGGEWITKGQGGAGSAGQLTAGALWGAEPASAPPAIAEYHAP